VSALSHITDMMGRNLRKILPDQYSYTLIVWRRMDAEKVEMASVSHGNPEEVHSILQDVSEEVLQHRELAVLNG
jgi:hypothetical protein